MAFWEDFERGEGGGRGQGGFEREGQGGDLESGQGWQERWVVRLKDQRTSKRACVYINQQMMSYISVSDVWHVFRSGKCGIVSVADTPKCITRMWLIRMCDTPHSYDRDRNILRNMHAYIMCMLEKRREGGRRFKQHPMALQTLSG